MSDEILNTNNHDSDSKKTKRRIVRRIVRRVPKKKDIVSNLDTNTSDDFYNSPKNINYKPSINNGYDDLIANEEPISPNESEPINNEPEDVSDPKDMILRQLSHNKKNIQHQISSNIEKNKSNDGIWPYTTSQPKEIDEQVVSNEDYGDEKRVFAWISWILTPIIITGLVVFALSYFAGAEVIITPKEQTLPIITNISTEKDADQSKLTPLSVLILEDSVSKDTQASEAKTTIATASGKVKIFNKQKVAQTLIKTTRLEAADGKIYRIRENIKIPAAVADKPGTFDVMVYAESAGPDYNKKSGTDFNIPGFKGKPQFDLVYAKSITDIAGGSSGVKKTVSKESMEEIAKAMRIELENKLRARVPRELLGNQVSYDSLYQFNYKDPVLESSDAPEKAKVVLAGTLALPVFDKTILSRELARATVKDYAGEDVTLNKIELLNVSIKDNQKVDIITEKKVEFHFEGTGKFTWSIDTDSFAKALLNISKNDIERVATKFIGIDKVTATLNPFWKSYFPGNTKDIKIRVIQQQ